jgi:hypothetical protein
MKVSAHRRVQARRRTPLKAGYTTQLNRTTADTEMDKRMNDGEAQFSVALFGFRLILTIFVQLLMFARAE